MKESCHGIVFFSIPIIFHDLNNVTYTIKQSFRNSKHIFRLCLSDKHISCWFIWSKLAITHSYPHPSYSTVSNNNEQFHDYFQFKRILKPTCYSSNLSWSGNSRFPEDISDPHRDIKYKESQAEEDDNKRTTLETIFLFLL